MKVAVSARGYNLFSAACWWDDAVHAQILDHLAVVIEAMRRGKCRLEESRGLPATFRGNRFNEVRAV